MTPERWEQIGKIYHSALELEPEERCAFLDKVCANDETLRQEVESLLDADANAGDFIARSAIKDAALLAVDSSPSLEGKSLGHYRILSRIGAGGMGEVYCAKDSKLGREVAIKTLPEEFCCDSSILQRFRTEARAAATLNHPCIATLYSVEDIDGCHFITMEYVAGKTFSEMIPEKGLDLKVFLEWFIPISDALSHAHERGITHRDIKPGNIMITPEGIPKMLDFGLARIEGAVTANEESTLTTMTRTGQILGTPAYMSPEQAEGREVDNRSDIFSLGVVMYEALTGERPFKGSTYASLVSNLLKSEPESITDLKPETPFMLSRLIMRCLNKERRHRYQTMREVRVILEEIKAAVDAGVSMDKPPQPLLSNFSLSRRWVIAPIVLLLIAVTAFALYRFTRKDAQPPISFENMTLRKLSQTNNVIYAQITPDGKAFAYTTIEENDRRALWIRRVEDRNALQLLPPQPISFWGGTTIPSDGSHIYYIVAGKDARHGTIYRISSFGGTPRKIVDTINDLGSLSPDEQRILYVRYNYGEKNDVQILSANSSDGSDERLIHTSQPNEIIRNPQYSVDGKHIFFVKVEKIKGGELWSLVEIPATGGAAERVIPSPRKPRIQEAVVLRDGAGILINATDPISNLPQLFHISLSDGKERRITNDLNSYFGVSVSNDGKTILTTQRYFARDVWIMPEGNSNEARKLTSESNVYLTAVWTPDGKIVYDAVDNNRPHIWIMNGDGTNAQQLTPNNSSDFQPAISPDGRYIVFLSERTGERKIWRMNIDGSNPQILTHATNVISAPSIAPDGQTVMFAWDKGSEKVLGKVPLAGGTVTEQSLYSESFWAISPDGKQLAYSFYDEQSKEYKVGVRPIDKNEPTTVFNMSPYYIFQWTPDGKGLLYREIEPSPTSNSTVLFQPITGGEPKPFLTVEPDTIFGLSRSSDGKNIAVIRGKLISDAVMLKAVSD